MEWPAHLPLLGGGGVSVAVPVAVNRPRLHHASLSVQNGRQRPSPLPPLTVSSSAHERPPAAGPLFFPPPPPPHPPSPKTSSDWKGRTGPVGFEAGSHTKRRRFVSSRDKTTSFQFFIFYLNKVQNDVVSSHNFSKTTSF